MRLGLSNQTQPNPSWHGLSKQIKEKWEPAFLPDLQKVSSKAYAKARLRFGSHPVGRVARIGPYPLLRMRRAPFPNVAASE